MECMRYCSSIFLTLKHNIGKIKTVAGFLLRLEIDPHEKLILKVREDVPTQPIEVNVQSTGITQKYHVVFHTEDAELQSEEQLWQRKQKNVMLYTRNRPS